MIRPHSTPTVPVASRRFSRGCGRILGETRSRIRASPRTRTSPLSDTVPASPDIHECSYPCIRTAGGRRNWSASWRSSWQLGELQVRSRSKSESTQISPDGVERCVNLGVQFPRLQVPMPKRMCIRTPSSTLVEDVKDDILVERRDAGDCLRQDVEPVEEHDWICSDWSGRAAKPGPSAFRRGSA
jgi:hypothetical protein